MAQLSAALFAIALSFGGLALSTGAGAQELKPDAPVPSELTPRTYRIWPGRAPNATDDRVAETPTLTLFRPQFPTANSPAVVIAPGGGYIGLATRLEGAEPAAWFTSRGVTVFVLTYRVGGAARLPIPLLDGTRAIRFVRAHAAELKVDPRRIGMMGFSAGGHLAAMTAVEATAGQLDAPDPVERVSSRPDFLILAYPWLEATKLRPDGTSSYCEFANYLRGAVCNPKEYSRFLPTAHIDSKAPPTFIYHTSNDETVPVMGSIRFYQALVDSGVPAEFHGFEAGRHGSGLGGQSRALSRWPDLLDEWLRGRGVIDGNPPKPASDTLPRSIH